MALLPGQVNAGIYYNEIQAAVGQRVQTQTLFEALTAAHYEATGELGSFNFAQVTQLRSLAARSRNASEAFMAAANTEAIGPQHVGAIPNAAVPALTGGPQRILVRYEQNIMSADGSISTVWRTNEFRAGLPPTKQSLLNRLNRDAATLSEEYEETHLGIGQVSILAA